MESIRHTDRIVRFLWRTWHQIGPSKYYALSSDGRLVAVAGCRGLIHYSATSGRWKTLSNINQEQAFFVKGELAWFNHLLITTVEVAKSYQVCKNYFTIPWKTNLPCQIHLYSRNLELNNQNILHCEEIASPVVILSLVDNSYWSIL